MRIQRQRVLVTLVITVLGATLGIAAGYQVTCALMVRQAQARLGKFASRILEHDHTSRSESRTLLAKMNDSPFSFCSPNEIAYFRTLVFNSEYLKSAGRMRDGRIVCSTVGAPDPSAKEYKPDLTESDGTRVYRNPAMFRIPGQTVIAVQRGDAFAVYGPYNFAPLGSDTMRYSITVTGNSGSRVESILGDEPEASNAVLTTPGDTRNDENLYATRCIPGGTICTTAFQPVSAVLGAGRGILLVFLVAGGLLGAFVGFALSLLYRRRVSLHAQLLRAIRRDSLRVVYQPIVDLTTGRVVEAEALVRWTDDDHQVVPPDVFVKAAEAHGFVALLTRLVVRHVIEDFRETMLRDPEFRVNVNVAASDLSDPGFLPMLDEALTMAGLHASSLGIEITESYTARQDVAKAAILRLRERGHMVHIDDFGTGYSSLAYLHDLSVDAIKIDKAFTRSIGTDAVTVSILPQILSMAEQLNLLVVVEGIETREQARYFAARQSIYGQGWLFGRPVTAMLFHSFLKDTVFQPELAEDMELDHSGAISARAV